MGALICLRLLLTLVPHLSSTGGSSLYPIIVPNVTQLLGTSTAGNNPTLLQAGSGYYRELLVDEATHSIYVGARSYIYKINFGSSSSSVNIINANITSASKFRPNFGPDSAYGTEDNPSSFISQYLNATKNGKAIVQLLATEMLASTYKLPNVSFENQCRRQIRLLRFYYGTALQHALDPDVVCTAHARGLALVAPGSSASNLFSLRTGLFGTMAAAPTGVNNFNMGWPKWRQAVEALAASVADPLVNDYTIFTPPADLLKAVYSRIANASRTCYSCNYTRNASACLDSSSAKDIYKLLCYNPPAVENFMALHGVCDYRVAPTRIIYNASNLGRLNDDVWQGGEREPCTGGMLASMFLAGYHPDQRTVSFVSKRGNGPSGNRTAVYILTEIGQEKQLDVNHEAFMGYEEPAPLTSSASLAIVRLLVNNDDVDKDSVIVSNPFKYTWITSPATKFGRMVKTGNMATVPHRPRAVAIYEDESFIYFFFREVDWESQAQPEYSVQRYHYLWRSYDRTIAYPWEKSFVPQGQTLQPERTTPAKYWLERGRSQPDRPDTTLSRTLTNFERNEHVYNPSLHGWKQTWNEARMTGRVARVCKNDRGLQTGTLDASFFNLDNKLSLKSFQTFIKTRLTCSVAVPATPRSWRLRQDLYSFLWTLYFSQYPEYATPNYEEISRCLYGCDVEVKCQVPFYNCTDCSPLNRAASYGASCDFNKNGRDVTFRALMNYADDFSEEAVDKAAFRLIVEGWKDFHWSYLRNFPTYSASYVQYNELRDIFRIGDIFYGVFGSHLSDEQAHMVNANTKGLPHQAVYGSAVCKYTLKDIQQAFNGPFKKRINNAWRPVDPNVGSDPISPSPYSCDPDPTIEEQAKKLAGMNIDFADFTLPLSEELKDFDSRSKSARINFFEKDVEGSRTMWQDVNSTAFISHAGKIFDIIVVDTANSYDVLFIATSEGEILKIVTWPQEGSCWRTDDQTLQQWWRNDTKLLNNAWGSYFSMTQESKTDFPNDFLFRSQWDCSPSTNHSVLAALRPFSGSQKIWSMKIINRTLIVSTDTQVIQMSVEQCHKYMYCDACTKDPYCGWNSEQMQCQTYTDGLLQNVTGVSGCKEFCATYHKEVQIGDNVLLDVMIAKGNPQAALAWYYNHSEVVEAFPKVFRTENGSLALISVSSLYLGIWELRDSGTQGCIVVYNLTLSTECSSQECSYKREYDRWKTEYDTFSSTVSSWYRQLNNDNCLADDATTASHPGTQFP